MKKIVFIGAIFWFLGIGVLTYAADGKWRDDFDKICARTADVGKLGNEELNGLIVESDELLHIIESSDDPKKKIYLIRLKKCRNFFIFMRGSM